MAAPKSQITSAPSVRSARFYIDTVTFKVENTLYKVPRGPFISQSVIFKDMFEAGNLSGHSLSESKYEGYVDDQPIVLEQVAKHEWEFFLAALLEPATVKSTGSVLDWASVISLSERWIMKTLYERARLSLEAAARSTSSSTRISGGFRTPVEKMMFARRCHRSKWLEEAFLMLITRRSHSGAEFVSVEEIRSIPLEKVVQLFAARERYQMQTFSPTSTGSFSFNTSPHPKQEEATAAASAEIKRIFQSEIKELDAAYHRIFDEVTDEKRA